MLHFPCTSFWNHHWCLDLHFLCVECPFAGLPIAITINITVAITIIVAALVAYDLSSPSSLIASGVAGARGLVWVRAYQGSFFYQGT